MAATLARRSAPLRLSLRSAISQSSSSSSSSSVRSSISSHLPSKSLSSRFQCPLRRESLALSSMLPIRSAIASARLVSRLPSESSACIQVRFANYVSPI